jgi:hypothetical protein
LAARSFKTKLAQSVHAVDGQSITVTVPTLFKSGKQPSCCRQ